MSQTEENIISEENTTNSDENIVVSQDLKQIKNDFLQAINDDNVEFISKHYHLKLIPEVKLVIYSVIQNLNNIFNYCLSQNVELAHQVLNDNNGYRLLEYVCQYGRFDMLNTLTTTYQTDINRINTNSINQQTYLPVNICIYEKHNDLIKCLLNHNLDCSIGHNLTGNTALHMCVLSNNHQGLDLILQSEINANMINCSGNTPLHLAAYINDYESVVILVKHGANINSKNFNYNTPIDLALLEDNQEIIKFMRDNNAQASYGNSIEVNLSM